MQFVAIPHRSVEEAWQKADCIHHQRVSVPAANRVTGPARFDILRMIFQIEVDGPLQSKLSVFQNDVVFGLGNAVDGSVERPVKDNARRFTTKTRIVISLE